MKCSDIRRKLTAFSDGELTQEAKELVSRHLDSCADCRHELDKLTRLSNELNRLEAVEVTPYFMTRIKQRIADRQTESFRLRKFPVWIRRVAIPAGAIAVVILASQVGGLLGRAMAARSTLYAARYTQYAGSARQSGLDLLYGTSVGSLAGVCDSIFPGGNIE